MEELWGEDTAGEETRMSARLAQHMEGRRQDQRVPPGPDPLASILTVAVWEACESRSTCLAPLPCEVGPAVAAASQVLTRPVCEI